MVWSTRVVGARRERAHRMGRSQSRGGRADAVGGAGRRDGFTLIELLVVLAIIMILIGIMIPSLRGARDAGRTAVCLSNQKQIGAALANYANASKDIVPREGTDVVEAHNDIERRSRICWPVALRPFLDDRVSVNEDPNDLFENAPYYADPARPKDGHRVHYVVNAMPMVSRGVVDVAARVSYWRRRGPEPLNRLQHPATTLYMTEFSDDADQSLWNLMQTRSREDLTWSQLYDIWDILHLEPASGQYRIAAARHSGAGNATFLDGHSLTMKRADLENLDTWDDHDYGIRDETPAFARQ